jgi:hypothetical protein
MNVTRILIEYGADVLAKYKGYSKDEAIQFINGQVPVGASASISGGKIRFYVAMSLG